MRKLVGIIMIAIALFFLALIGKSAFTLPATQKQLKEAVFVEGGSLLPENEGKLVVVFGSLEASSNARDDDLGLTLPSPVAVRYVEQFTIREDGSGWKASWDPITENSTEWLKQARLYGDLRFGDYELSEELLRGFPAGRELARSLLDADEVSALEEYVDVIESGGVLYFSEAPAFCFGNGKLTALDLDYSGLRRVHYKYLEQKSGDAYAVAGIQRGSRLVRDESLDASPVFEGARTPEDVIRQNGTGTILGMALAAVACLLLIFFGVRRVRE